MARFFLTLHSALDNQAGIGVFDTECGLQYLQIEDLVSIETGQLLRGLCCVGQHLYVTTRSTLRIYRILQAPEPDEPWLSLEREVCRPEWLLGGKVNAELTAIHYSSQRDRLYVACNSLAAIDEFTLAGEFIERRHLWEIAPAHFQGMANSQRKHVFGHIRGIFDGEDGELFLSIAFRNGGEHSCVLSYDGGELLLDGMPPVHSGLVHGGRFFVLDVQGGRLLGKSPQGEDLIGHVASLNPDEQGMGINLRGLLLQAGKFYAGMFSLGRGEKKIASQVVRFDAATARQELLYPLPIIPGFRHPACFYMSGLRLDSVLPVTPDLLCFKGGLRIAIEQEAPAIEEPAASAMPVSEVARPLVTEVRKAVIELAGVTLSYRRTARFSLLQRARASHYHRALSDISLAFYEGEVVGLIGRNGSGKSTMGMLLSGILQPDQGRIERHGRIQLLSLGIGFNNELSGRDNVFVNAALLGLSRRQVLEHLDEIVDFAELGEFIDEPIRTYSAGMRSRLAFAIATVIQPDVLILDEVLSTGDDSFRHKAENRMREMKGKAKCVVMVSHSASQIKKLCTRVVWLERGRLMMDGAPRQVMPEYESFCQNPEKWLLRHPHYAEKLQA